MIERTARFYKPFKPWVWNRRNHLPTVGTVVEKTRSAALLPPPRQPSRFSLRHFKPTGGYV